MIQLHFKTSRPKIQEIILFIEQNQSMKSVPKR